MEKSQVEPNEEPHLVPVAGNLLDSRTGHLDDALSAKLEEALDEPTMQVVLHDVAQIAKDHDPIDLAYACTRLPPASRIIIFDNLPDLNSQTTFMIHAGRSTRSAIFKQIDDQLIKKLIENMPPDEAVWIIDDMSDRRSRRILDLLDPLKAQHIRELQQHDRESAGRLMTNEFFAFHFSTTIGEVAREIRSQPGIDLTRCVFVLNDDETLAGYVTGRSLIVNLDQVAIGQVMSPVLHTVHAETSRDEVVDIVERYQVPALPVVDDKDHLVGVITYEDVVEAMEDIADATIASIAGTGEDISEHEPLLRRFFHRLPWLVVTLLAGLISATVMSYFSEQVWFFVFLPFFVPLITGMSGNVGIVCSTVLVRSMSTGEISAGTKGVAIRNELTIGLLIGLSFGVLSGLIVFILNMMGAIHADPVALGFTTSFGLLAACLTATFLGTFSPFFFARLKVDPAIAAGPFITAFNDVLSTLMFFFAARVIYALVSTA